MAAGRRASMAIDVFGTLAIQDTGGARGGRVEANLRLALVEKAADGGGGFVRAFRASQLPRNLKERFAAIFAFKPRWILEELEPYLEATADATVEAQLLKYTRVSQPDAKATATYSKR